MEQEASLVVKQEQTTLPALQVSPAEFLVQNSPVKVIEKYNEVTTSLMAIDRSIPSLLDLDKTYGREYVVGYIKLWMLEIADYLGTTHPTDQQLNLSAQVIFDKNKFLNLADIKLIVEQILSGEIAISGTITAAKLCPIFSRYWEDRQIKAIEHTDKQDQFVLKTKLSEDAVIKGYQEKLAESMRVKTEREAKVEDAKNLLNERINIALTAIKKHKND